MTKEQRELLEKHRADSLNCRRWIDVSKNKANSIVFNNDKTVTVPEKNILDTLNIVPGMKVVGLEPDNTMVCNGRIFIAESEPRLKKFGDKFIITFDVKDTGESVR